MDTARRPALGAMRPLQQRLARLRALVLLCFLFLALEIVHIALASPRLSVREVVVRGDPVVAALAAERIELPANTSMLRAPLALVRRQAESCPAVRGARVGRDLPRRLVVTVERREPVAAIRRASGAVLLDREGMAFQVPGEWGWGLPELIAPSLSSGEFKEEAARQETGLLLATLGALGPDPRLRASRVQLGPEGEIQVTLESGPQVNLGQPENLAGKVKLLAAALDQVGADRIQRIDLSDPASAYWEPREDTERAAAR